MTSELLDELRSLGLKLDPGDFEGLEGERTDDDRRRYGLLVEREAARRLARHFGFAANGPEFKRLRRGITAGHLDALLSETGTLDQAVSAILAPRRLRRSF